MKKQPKSSIVLAFALLFSAQLQATELDLNIASRSINGQLNLKIPTRQGTTSEFEAGGGYIYREGGTNIGNIDFHALGQTVISNLPTTARIGARAIYFDKDSANGSALALGGGAQVNIPQVPGLGIRADAHFAPSVTSFGDTDHLFRIDVRTTYRIIQNADVYAGYRVVRAKQDNEETKSVDENVHIGFTLLF